MDVSIYLEYIIDHPFLLILSHTPPPNLALALHRQLLATPCATFGGQPADSNSLLLAPELLGDGTVNTADLNTVLSHFGQQTPNWTDGNFDYTSTIDLTDLAYVLNNFGMTLSNPSTTPGAPPIATPEPTTLTLLLPTAALLLTRRRPTRSPA